MPDEFGGRDRLANLSNWSREGFLGARVHVTRAHHVPDYLSVSGPHTPHLLNVGDLALPDRDDPEALPVPFLVARAGLEVSASGRRAPMPFVFTNVEADEVHFVQSGELQFRTEYGTIIGSPGDFVCIPRAVPYQIRPIRTPTLSVIVEVQGAVGLKAPGQVEVERPAVDPSGSIGDETVLLVKSFDGITRYVKPHDPLAGATLRDDPPPVWKLNLARNQAALGGPPNNFASSPHNDVLLINVSARLGSARPPMHQNADYDELTYYFAGPGAYGAITEPGTVTWVPKGIVHHGPSEDVPEGYLAWMVESRSTLRLTPDGQAIATVMELDQYGRRPATTRARATVM